MAEQPAAQVKPSTSFLTDHKGKPSAMRAMSVVCLAVAVVLSVGGVFHYDGAGIDHQLIGLFLLAAFAPKAVQAFAETNLK